MRVSKSPSGSFIGSFSLPARLGHAGDQALAGQLAQHVAAHLELAVVAARPARQLAAVANTRGRGVARQLGELESGARSLLARLGQVGGDLFQPLALGSETGNHRTTVVVLVDRALLSHAVLQALAALRCEMGS